ncbi:MAG: T9SS type A sorting domain-containing protein [Candidatus Stahlbacteria bacterium]|nr:T9SS type A sorting domain-containing protein [Candidatus Stahlbacteria bacterium]
MKYILAALLFAGSAFSAPLYVMTKSDFSSAGGIGSSANYILKDAAGQSVTGESKSATYIEQAGLHTYSQKQYISVEENDFQPLIPKVFNLSYPSPNPVAHIATIRYAVPKVANVHILVYDVSGRVVKTLVSGEKKPAFYSINWNGESDNGNRVAQGVYFVRMVASDYTATKKLIFVK